jgi:hypothetical protein
MSRKQDKYIKSISLKVKVDGIVFESAMSGARYILSKEPE